MNITDLAGYIPVIGVPLAGAVAWIWNEYRKDKKEKADSDITRERTYADRLEARLKDRESDIERLTKDVMTLRLNGNENPEDILKSIIDNDPGVSWAKKRIGPRNYIMVRVSLGYARDILKGAPESYDGKTDAQVWPADVAAKFTENDEAVYMSQQGLHLVEDAVTGKFVGRKFPLRLATDDYIIGVGSYELNQKS